VTRLKFIPRAWQPPIICHVFDTPRNAVFAGMGLGKTTSAMTALDALYLTGDITGPTLVCAPLRVATSTWPDEAKKWEHLRHIDVQPVVGSPQQRRQALSNTNASVFTINYENLPWLVEYIESQRKPWPFAKVIADEATKLKGFRLRQGTQRARALATVAHKYVGRWTNLTGTPAPNGLKDLWGQTWFIDAGERLGRTFSAFESRWFRQSRDGFNRFSTANRCCPCHRSRNDMS
jgi:SNF2 family DNA or RNA helicase